MVPRSTVFFRAAHLVTMNLRRDVYCGDLLVEDGLIKAVGRDLAAPAGAEIVAAGRLTLIPGLVQTHVHLAQTLFRCLADDLDLLDWLMKRIWPLEGGHDPDSVETAAYLGISELLRGGTTCIVDMETVHHTGRAFEAIDEAGIRAIAGKAMMDEGAGAPATLLEETDASLGESLALLDRWHGADRNRIRYAFCPRFALSCSEGLLERVRDAARHHEVLIHTHASENRAEVAQVLASRACRNVTYFDSLGMTGPKLLLAHCVWLDDAEIEILARTGTRVCHCPSSNLKLGSGIAAIPELLDRGVSVSLGADGAACNNNLDMFGEMRLASLIQKPRLGPATMPAPLVFELATLGGARAIGQEDRIGSLEVGKRADVVALDLTGCHVMPATEANVYSQLIYAARASDVKMTLVDGRILYRNERVLSIDENALAQEVPRALGRVLARAGIPDRPRFPPPTRARRPRHAVRP